ncbi:MAG: helix-turn-helix transcriptional regulator [Clostridiales bacterium]|nr:helix-turn-helix transcriptional regulator [Clostridiales bacterium]
MSIGDRIKEKRINLGFSQVELAKLIGVTKGAVGNYENDTSIPKTEILLRIFDALKTDANYLYQDYMEDNKDDFILQDREKQKILVFRKLDSFGKDLVNTVLDMESMRCENQHVKGNNIKVSKPNMTKAIIAAYEGGMIVREVPDDLPNIDELLPDIDDLLD